MKQRTSPSIHTPPYGYHQNVPVATAVWRNRYNTCHGGGLGLGGLALIEGATTIVTPVRDTSPCLTSSASNSPPVTAASSASPAIDARFRSKIDTANATFTAACARVLISESDTSVAWVTILITQTLVTCDKLDL